MDGGGIGREGGEHLRSIHADNAHLALRKVEVVGDVERGGGVGGRERVTDDMLADADARSEPVSQSQETREV